MEEENSLESILLSIQALRHPLLVPLQQKKAQVSEAPQISSSTKLRRTERGRHTKGTAATYFLNWALRELKPDKQVPSKKVKKEIKEREGAIKHLRFSSSIILPSDELPANLFS